MKKTAFIILFFLITVNCFSGTTGKIYGTITDAETGKPVPAASIVLPGLKLGAATDPEGKYFIINVNPGSYKLKVVCESYQETFVENVVVIADKSTRIDIKLNRSGSYDLSDTMEEIYLKSLPEPIRKDLIFLKQRDKLEYQARLRDLYFDHVINNDSELHRLSREVIGLKVQIKNLAKELSGKPDKERKALEKKIQGHLENLFDLEGKKMYAELKELKKQLGELEKAIETREKEKKEIIEEQFNSLAKLP